MRRHNFSHSLQPAQDITEAPLTILLPKSNEYPSKTENTTWRRERVTFVRAAARHNAVACAGAESPRVPSGAQRPGVAYAVPCAVDLRRTKPESARARRLGRCELQDLPPLKREEKERLPIVRLSNQSPMQCHSRKPP